MLFEWATQMQMRRREVGMCRNVVEFRFNV